MHRGIVILATGLLTAAFAFYCVYHLSTKDARQLAESRQPELAWLQHEFNLSPAEFQRITDLHAAYLPQCRALCLRIDSQNSRLQELIANAPEMTPEIEGAIAEAGRLRAECQIMMLRHFFQVSQTMPPPQRDRYLAWVHQKTILPDHGMNKSSQPPTPPH